MNLFPGPFIEAGSIDRAIRTPAGIVTTRLHAGALDAETCRPSRAGVSATGDRWTRWSASEGDAELLVRALRTKHVPETERPVDGCVAAVWRFRAAGSVAPRFDCELTPAEPADGGQDSGEHLLAQTWTVGRHQVSMGTQDEEALSHRASRGDWMPRRLERGFLSGDWPSVLGLDVGLVATFPDLGRGERLQVHFVVAWVERPTGSACEDECAENDDLSSTSFAVDRTELQVLE